MDDRGRNMKQDELLDGLRPIFRDVFGADGAEIDMDTTYEDIPKWDSMNQVLLIVTIEDEFGVRFPIGEFQDKKSVASLVSELEKLL